MIAPEELVPIFHQAYGKPPRLFFAPGRVNLIGEHTDYNDGFVLPMAIDRGTIAAIAPRKDRTLRVRSLNLNEGVSLDLDSIYCGRRGCWVDYVAGVAATLIANGMRLLGADILLASDLSIGGGLSSSAALEISLATAMIAIAGEYLGKHAIAIAAQTAEHRYAGTKCGIMDQFAAVFGRTAHALLLDCRSLDAQQIPLRMGAYAFVICDSRVRHALASSQYNQRRADCETGVELLSASQPSIKALRDATLSDLASHQDLISPDVLRRCRHVITENDRTLKAAEALSNGDAARLGQLMHASHVSLRDDFEVSCHELNLLVDTAMAQPGVLGARMTGAGFGGCTVNLVAKQQIADFKEKVALSYLNETQLEPEIFVAESSDGAREIFWR